jgi:hypothetical protein
MRKTSLGVLLVAMPFLSFFTALALGAASDEALRFTDARKQTVEFLEYERTIKLTPEQQAVYREALDGLPAPCCSDNTALTCCCPCNAARAWWGLGKHLIANRGYDALETRAKVAEWFRFINPSGWSGNTCSTQGGCARPFDEGGCGGMRSEQLAF